MAYTLGNVCLFVVEYRELFGDQAPQVVINAMAAVDPNLGAIVDGSIDEVMGENAALFRFMVPNDLRHIALFAQQLAGEPLDIALLLAALFDEDEISQIVAEEPDQTRLPAVIGRRLRAKGFAWEDEWLGVIDT